MTLDELAAREEELLARVAQAEGTLDERATSLQQASIFAAYRQVHHDYGRLLHDPQQGLEALKRALFLQWYANTEPCPLTGLNDLDRATEVAVMQELERRVAHQQLDDELAAMLRHQHRVTDWYVASFGPLPHLGAYLATVGGPLVLKDVMTRASLQARGQLGRYYQSILAD